MVPIMVLPHPGGPCNSTPLGALVNFEWANKSLSLIGKITVSLSSSITDSRPATDQILYFNFSLKPLRFFLTRNTSDTKISRAKSWATSIIKLTKTPILQNCQFHRTIFVFVLVIYNCSDFVSSYIFLCHFLSWQKIWEDWKKILNTKSEPMSSQLTWILEGSTKLLATIISWFVNLMFGDTPNDWKEV